MRGLQNVPVFRTSCVVASGLKGLPFSIPIDLSRIDHGAVSLSARARSGRCGSSDSKKRTSYGMVASKTTSMRR